MPARVRRLSTLSVLSLSLLGSSGCSPGAPASAGEDAASGEKVETAREGEGEAAQRLEVAAPKGGAETGGTETGGTETGGTETGGTETETGETETGDGAKAAAPSGPPVLLVGTPGGLVEYDLDGKPGRARTQTPASWPRLAKDGSVLFLQPKAGDYVLMRLPAGGAAAQAIAKVPTVFDEDGCKLVPAGGKGGGLEVQSSWGFRVEEVKGRACMSLADRNDNMADVEVNLRIDLASGKVESALDFTNYGECPAGKHLECGGIDAAPDGRAKTARGSFAWQWDGTQALLFPKGAPRDPRAKRLCMASIDLSNAEERDAGCATGEGYSSSGRFMLLGGLSSEGDYIHRELFVADLSTGEILAVKGETHDYVAMNPDAVVAETFDGLDAVGESDVRWVGDGTEGHDRLWLDGALLNPVARTYLWIGGQLATTI